MREQAKLFLLFDMLGDIERSGPKLWHINRDRLEDIKDHIFDIITMDRILEPYFPINIDHSKIIDLAIVHDLEEVITGDITLFEGITKEEKDRVNNIAIDYIVEKYGHILPFKDLYNEFENITTIEAKICHMLDKVQSIIPFARYDYEELVDMDNSLIIEELRNLPLIVKGKEQGKTLSELFYDYHIKSVCISDEELLKYNISRAEADSICSVIKAFIKDTMIETKNIDNITKDFPKNASIYKH